MLNENVDQSTTTDSTLLDKIKDVFFIKTSDDKSNLMYENNSYFHIYYNSDKENVKHKETIDEIKVYIKALAEKLLVESKNIYENIDALPTFVDSVVTSTDTIIDNIQNCDDRYSPFISDLEEDQITIKDKPLVLAIKIGITKTNVVLPTPMLIWVVSSHSWKANEKDPSNFDLINTIELLSE